VLFSRYSTRTRIFIWATVLWGAAGALGVVEGVWALFSAEPLIPVVYNTADKVLPTTAKPLALAVWALVVAAAVVWGYRLTRRVEEPSQRIFQVATPNGAQETTNPVAITRSVKSVRIAGELPKNWSQNDYTTVDVTFEVSEPARLSRLGLLKEGRYLPADELPTENLEGLSVYRVMFRNKPNVIDSLTPNLDIKTLRLLATVDGRDRESEAFGMYFTV
jgi:hypothetical protein